MSGTRMVSRATGERANAFLEREDLLDAAIHDGRISANLREHYAACFDRDPAGTRDFLGKLGARQQASVTPASTGPDEYPTAGLSRAEQTRIAAAREGCAPGRIVNGGL
jgi:hypothetical protein